MAKLKLSLRMVEEMLAASGIPSFYAVLHLEVVCHDLFGPIILFQQRGFHRAVIALAATGFVRSPIGYG